MATDDLPLRFKTLWRHCAALSEDSYRTVKGLGDRELEENLRCAARVAHGGMLLKFRKAGREKPHRSFVKVVGGSFQLSGRRTPVALAWDRKNEIVVRADAEVYGSCFQGDSAPDGPGCFQVILDKRMLFLVADSPEDKEAWVRGINAIVSYGISPLQRDDERLGAEVTPDEGNWVAVLDGRTKSVYMRDFASRSVEEFWIQPAIEERTARSHRADVRAPSPLASLGDSLADLAPSLHLSLHPSLHPLLHPH